MYGNFGRILNVDLSTGTIRVENHDEQLYRMYLGGNGLAAKLIHDRVPRDAGPLDPDNAIVLSVGPLTHSPVWGSSRGHIAAISPLTGFFADSNFGGDYPAAQKRTGFDAICITGRSPRPVYLSVSESGAELLDGTDLWGKTTLETFSLLKNHHGKKAECLAIGPGGENRVLFANILGSGKRHGASGRGGMGTVLGAKNLKAVVAKGEMRTQLFDRDGLSKILKEKFEGLKQGAKPLSVLGTPVLVNIINGHGLLGTHNNSREVFEHAGDISGEVIKENYWEEDTACYGCPVACGKNVAVAEGDFAGQTVKMPEYETIYALGSMLDNGDLQSIFNGNHLCDLMGLDTISMGVTLSFSAECMERGIVSEKELGGRVNFSEGPAAVELIRKTALREGIGNQLALGSTRLAESFGADAQRLLYAVQGMEIAGHSARGLRGMSLSYPTSTRGGSHHDGRPQYTKDDPGFEPQPQYIVKNQYFTAVGDSLVLCRFVAERGMGTPLNEDMVRVVNAVTGWNLGLADLEQIGERIYNLERLINVGRGVSRKHDVLPHRVMNEPIPDGPAEGRYCSRADLDAMLDTYYELRGWTPDGVPTPEKLAELGLA